MILHRRRFLQGLVSALAAPAIVRVDSIMPIRSLERVGQFELLGFDPITGDAIVGLRQIRQFLLPGLWEITSKYDPDGQWDRIFHANHKG